ncbi:MAG: hypothetical protein P8074_20810 [Anaerolineales bacterium]
MLRRKYTTRLILTLAFFLSVLVVSCNQQPPGPAPSPTPQSTYAVGPIFAQFYNILGGSEVLGAPISPVFEEDGLTYQYTTASLMVYNPDAPANRRFLLAPLGLSMDLNMYLAAPTLQTPGTRTVDGYTIYSLFVPLYDDLGGENVVGKPLTDVNYNQERNRIEQYFENLGFYLPGGDLDSPPRLLAYGAWACEEICGSTFPPLNSIIDVPKAASESAPPVEEEAQEQEEAEQEEATWSYFYMPLIAQNAVIEQVFNKALGWFKFNLPIVHRALPDRTLLREAVNRLGSDFTGFALTEPYLTPDGKLEQIFENVVLRVGTQQEIPVELRPLPELLGISQGPLESPSADPAMEFYAIEDDQGFNVPAYFWHYLNLHGGEQVSGPPITRFELLDDQVYWQCFRNLCLEEHRVTPEGLLIRPTALGYQYKDHFYRPPETQLPEPAGKELSIQVWESSPFVASNQEQKIEVSVQENNSPLPGVVPVLTLTLPNASPKTYYFPATGPNGRTSLRLPPIQAANSTLIQYQICIPDQNRDKFCIKDSYLIWNNP